MYTKSITQWGLWLVVGLLLVIATACGQAAAPQVVEKVVTVEVEKIVEKEVEKVVTVEVEKEVEVAVSNNAADIAVEAARQYAGTTLNVTWEAGLQAQDPLLFSGPEWERLTGIKVNIIETPFTELFSKPMAEHLAGSGAIDIINVVPAWTGDFVAAGALEPLDSFIEQYYPAEELDDFHPTYKDNYMKWGDTIYGIPDDGDTLLMYYRRDWFEDEQNQAEFKERFGYDLAPPKTWPEWDEICQFFTEKFAPEAYGCAIQRAEGQSYFWYEARFRNNGGEFFDPDTMAAQLNSDVGVQTMADMVNSNQWMPPGVEKWGFIEVFQAWLDGQLGMIISWPPIGRWSEGYGTQTAQLSWVPETKVAGKVGYAIPPGGAGQIAASFNLSISSNSQNKEAAYLFIQWLTSKDVSLQRVMLPFALRDPYRISHYESGLYRTQWENAPEYLDALKEAAEVGLLDLSIPGAREYEEALDRAIQSAYAGTDPQEAMDTAAAEWDDITERIGLEEQKASYAIWSANKNAYQR